MTVSSRTVSPARAETPEDVETFQILVVFSGMGLVLSLFLAAIGWI
jgi:hypothetical protein